MLHMKDELSPRVGIFICECGGKIADALDTETLCQQSLALPGVVYAIHEAYPCSKDGQARLRQAIEDQHLDRVLVAGCTPRLVEKLFRQAVQSELDPAYLSVADIREHAAYIQSDKKAALSMATGILDMGVSRLAATTASPPHIGRVVKSALVVGSGLSALTVALALADGEKHVILIEKSNNLGTSVPDLQERTRQLLVEKSQIILNHPMIDTLFNAHIMSVSGHPGDYEVSIQHGDQTSTYSTGVIIVDNGALPKPLDASHWFDRSKVKTQAEFEQELEKAADPNKMLDVKDIVMIFCAEETQRQHCSRTCCNIGIRQAIRAKQLNPNANVTILFRELYLGGVGQTHEPELIEAQKMGVAFFRYRQDHPPVIAKETVDIFDTLTGESLRLPYDRVALTAPFIPQDDANTLAALLSLPQDAAGFLAEPRMRLRPGRYADPGIYILGSAQQPADTTEALFQAYLTSARASRFLNQESITVDTSVAIIDSFLCTGCGNCPQVCPTQAIHLEKRDGVLSLSEVDDLRCIGCGNCVVVCPVKAISLPGWDDIEIPAQISAALQERQNGKPKVLALTCEWSAYGAADIAGARHIPYSPNVRILRMNCSARFDPYHILWAFLNGADGVFLGACPVGECHYGVGNLFARERTDKLKTELSAHGIDPSRLHLEYLTVDDGKKFADAVTAFSNKISHLSKKGLLTP
jgi:heterodisulfide reductase subunit A2